MHKTLSEQNKTFLRKLSEQFEECHGKPISRFDFSQTVDETARSFQSIIKVNGVKYRTMIRVKDVGDEIVCFDGFSFVVEK